MIRIGIIGTGGMAGAHARHYQTIKGVKLAACCDIDAQRAQAFAEKWQIPSFHSDYKKMLADEDLDAVSNVTPDGVHAEVALGVLKRGLPILSEKPLAANLDEARAMGKAARKAGVPNMVNFSYRNSCALQGAAKAVAAGAIGQPRHVEASYLQGWLVSRGRGDWRTRPGLTWRLSTRHGSNGVLGDLGCHIYDMTALLAGDIAQVQCRLETFDKGVPGNRIGPYVLDANDSFVSTVVMANGAIGTVHSSRWATGQRNSLRVRVYGDEGAIVVDLDKSQDSYEVCRGRKAIDAGQWTTVKCRPTPSNHQRFVRWLKTGKADACDFANGVKVQACLEASILSARRGQMVRVPKA